MSFVFVGDSHQVKVVSKTYFCVGVTSSVFNLCGGYVRLRNFVMRTILISHGTKVFF